MTVRYKPEVTEAVRKILSTVSRNMSLYPEDWTRAELGAFLFALAQDADAMLEEFHSLPRVWEEEE